ncbi:hypothetical protein DERF_008702 [Dermatophagoides farinae]|uniref:Uncharacterized protein n=1 Tax=Dermatophagoides farinae TaxID=6954 RepID=A0A922I6A4_DERFA|nr:hypothetical protein DERF_008702 [Dermatophagoides farinae]
MKRCTANEFECIRDSTCIDLSSVGDGIIDCIDSSDECPDPIQQFRCRCGIPICIDRKHYMDGQINCDDGSDEGLEVTICQSFIQNELLPNGMLTRPQQQQPQQRPYDMNVPFMTVIGEDNADDDGEIDDHNTTTAAAAEAATNGNKYMADVDVDDPILLIPENIEELFSSEFFDSLSTTSSPYIDEITMNSTTTNNGDDIVSESNDDDDDDKDKNFSSSSSLSLMSSSSSSPSLLIDEQIITPNSSTIIMIDNTIETSTTKQSTMATTTSTSTSHQDVVELTGTFLPYELLTAPTKYPYYHRSMITPPILLEKLTETNSIVEITGTFIPQMMTQSYDSETGQHRQPMTTTITANNNTMMNESVNKERWKSTMTKIDANHAVETEKMARIKNQTSNKSNIYHWQ